MKIKNTLLAMALVLPAAAHAERLTIERIYESPSLLGSTVRSVKMSPDGERVTFLQGKKTNHSQLDLWEFDLATGEPKLLFDSNQLQAGSVELSDEEKARRERLRLRGSGIVSYQFSKDGRELIFPLGGDVYVYQIDSKKVTQLLDTPAFETDIRFSPDGRFLSFIRGQNLIIKQVDTGVETAVTQDGGGVIRNGMAEFVAQEEMGRMTGYWWSPDSKNIAFTRTDDTKVAVATRNEIYADRVETIEQKYPWAGTANVRVDLAVYNVDSGHKNWLELADTDDIYLARVNWQSADELTFQVQSRNQKTLELKRYHLASEKQDKLLQETSPYWVNLDGNVHFLTKREGFLWASERSGFNHLYWFDHDGQMKAQLTEGKWVVDGINYVDEKQGLIYFSGRKDSAMERHLYVVSLDKPKQIKRVTQREGMHSISFNGDGSLYIDRFSSVSAPQQVSLHKPSGDRVMWINENPLNASHPLEPYLKDLVTPEFGAIKADDGKTDLYYRLLEPANRIPGKQYPAIVFLYGGPGAQMVTKTMPSLWLQFLVQQGYVVMTLDNRGSANRGIEFEGAIYRRTGDVEVRDQIAAVKHLRALGYVDADKVGVMGYSYGGYMTLMSMFTAGDYFKAGAAGGSVTDWRLYDTHYTERYMGDPIKNKKGYDESAATPYAKNLTGELFIYHGMADDNVLFTNSTQVYRELQEQMIPFWAMDYPGEKHGMRDKRTRIHEKKMIFKFFETTIGQ